MGAERPVPESLRCRRSDGKQWRCSRRAEVGKSFCEFHRLQALRRQNPSARQAPPEHLRCRRTDGKRWRCPRWTQNGQSFCEIHRLQALRRQSRLPVPDSLKLPCLRRGEANPDREADSAGRDRKSSFSKGKDAPAAMRKRGRKVLNKELTMELIRMVVRQMLRRREERDKRKMEANGSKDVGIAGEAASSSSSSSTISLDIGSFLRWPFRSKNAEKPLLTAPDEMNSRGRRSCHGGKSLKTACQLCQESGTQPLVRCSSCRKVLFCMICVKKWYGNVSESEGRMACPICHGIRAPRQERVDLGR